MRTKPVRTRLVARADLERAVEGYLADGAVDAALGLVDAVESTLTLIAEFPGIGSTRFEVELGLYGLRSITPPGYPYLLLYLENDEYLDVLRLLHQRSDLPARFANAP